MVPVSLPDVQTPAWLRSSFVLEILLSISGFRASLLPRSYLQRAVNCPIKMCVCVWHVSMFQLRTRSSLAALIARA